MTFVNVFRDPWDADRGTVQVVRLDPSVLDQVLLGSSATCDELRALTDRTITLEEAAESTVPTPDLALLRAALHQEFEIRSGNGSARSGRTAFWSAVTDRFRRVELAEQDGSDLYDPDLVLKTSEGLTGSEALTNAKRLGAIDVDAVIELQDPSGIVIEAG